MFSLSGVARYLFVPLAEAVMFAVISSYVLSRTLVPTMIMWFERRRHERAGRNARPVLGPTAGRPCSRVLKKRSIALGQLMRDLLGTVLEHRAAFAVGFLVLLRCLMAARSLPWPKFLSLGGCRNVSIARARPYRHADRANRQAG